MCEGSREFLWPGVSRIYVLDMDAVCVQHGPRITGRRLISWRRARKPRVCVCVCVRAGVCNGCWADR
jgi:hypothetical protein